MPFMQVENACVFRASWAKPRLFFDNQGKNAQQCLKFSLGIFLFENENACVKNLKRHVYKHAFTCVFLLCLRLRRFAGSVGLFWLGRNQVITLENNNEGLISLRLLVYSMLRRYLNLPRLKVL